MSLSHEAVAACFREQFSHRYAVNISGGAAEPLYVPARDGKPAHLYYREDFAASALHEIAHWCVAGSRRRTQMDFGYTYTPPPRDVRAQQRFFQLELKVQTLESLFAEAAGLEFQPSADNLDAPVAEFGAQICGAQVSMRRWMSHSKDARAWVFCMALDKCHQASLLNFAPLHGETLGSR